MVEYRQLILLSHFRGSWYMQGVSNYSVAIVLTLSVPSAENFITDSLVHLVPILHMQPISAW